MSYEGLLHALDDRGHNVDPVGLAEALWLLRQVDALTAEAGPAAGPGTDEEPVDDGVSDPDRPRPEVTPARTPTGPRDAPPPDRPAQPKVPDAGPVPPHDPRPSRMRLRTELPVEQPFPLSRALCRFGDPHPLSRARVLDLDATVERTAEEDLPVPVYREGRSKWLRLTLVRDRGSSMDMWLPRVEGIQQLVKWQRAFHTIDVWELDSGREGGPLRRPGSRREHDPRDLLDPTGRAVILVVSDLVGRGWAEAVPSHLRTWARAQPVGILQVLPPGLWRRTWLRGWEAGTVSSAGFSAARDWDWEPEDFGWGETEAGARAPARLPVLQLEATSLRRFADLVLDGGEAWAVELRGQPLPAADPATLTAEERVRRFRASSSGPARKLASLMAASPVVNLPLLRLVREVLLPEATPAHEAEVLVGGLLEVAGHPEGGGGDEGAYVDVSARQYRFPMAVRRQLLSTARRSQVAEVYTLLAAELADEPWADVFLNPELAEELEGEEGEILRGVLGRLGKRARREPEVERPGWMDAVRAVVVDGEVRATAVLLSERIAVGVLPNLAGRRRWDDVEVRLEGDAPSVDSERVRVLDERGGQTALYLRLEPRQQAVLTVDTFGLREGEISVPDVRDPSRFRPVRGRLRELPSGKLHIELERAVDLPVAGAPLVGEDGARGLVATGFVATSDTDMSAGMTLSPVMLPGSGELAARLRDEVRRRLSRERSAQELESFAREPDLAAVRVRLPPQSLGFRQDSGDPRFFEAWVDAVLHWWHGRASEGGRPFGEVLWAGADLYEGPLSFGRAPEPDVAAALADALSDLPPPADPDRLDAPLDSLALWMATDWEDSPVQRLMASVPEVSEDLVYGEAVPLQRTRELVRHLEKVAYRIDELLDLLVRFDESRAAGADELRKVWGERVLSGPRIGEPEPNAEPDPLRDRARIASALLSTTPLVIPNLTDDREVVGWIQRRLRDHGHRWLQVDERLGPETRMATGLLQADRGLPVTGFVDGGTWEALEAVVDVRQDGLSAKLRPRPRPEPVFDRAQQVAAALGQDADWEGWKRLRRTREPERLAELCAGALLSLASAPEVLALCRQPGRWPFGQVATRREWPEIMLGALRKLFDKAADILDFLAAQGIDAKTVRVEVQARAETRRRQDQLEELVEILEERGELDRLWAPLMARAREGEAARDQLARAWLQRLDASLPQGPETPTPVTAA